jgi:tRNA(fMet)-specific endonuclease VapC
MNYLLDTCVVSDFFKKIPSVIENFKRLSPKQIHISAITVMEIEYGLNLHKEREKKNTPTLGTTA